MSPPDQPGPAVHNRYAEEDEPDGPELGLGAALRSLADREALRAAPALLRERGWWGGLLLVILLSVVFVLLGEWQWHRHEAKLLRRDVVTVNYDTAPVPLRSVLPRPDSPLPPDRQWMPVRASGRYQAGRSLLVRNRPLDEQTGYEQLVPLRLADGSVLVVDRGWLPAGRTGAAPDAVPPIPSGPVTVLVRLRPGEPASDRQAPSGQVQRIDLAAVARLSGEPVQPAYGVLAEETPPPGTAPTPLPRPDVDLGPHLSYTMQWWGFALAAYLIWAALLVREAQRRLAARREGP